MKKIMALLMCFTLNTIGAADLSPTIPASSNINSWKGIIINQNSVEAIVTYGICELTPADTQHKAVTCSPPFYTETITTGQHLNILIPKDLLDAQGNLITHYTATITQVKSNGLFWFPGPGITCRMDISKNLNAVVINENGTDINCTPGTVVCKDEQCQSYDFQPLKK